MAVRTISTSIKLDGEQEFNRQMKLVNSNLSTLKSELALVTSEFSGQANSLDALTRKNEILKQEYAQQIQKVWDLEKAVKESVQVNGDASQATDGYRRDLNYARIALQKFNEELEQNEKYLNEARNSADKTATSIDQYGRPRRTASSWPLPWRIWMISLSNCAPLRGCWQAARLPAR